MKKNPPVIEEEFRSPIITVTHPDGLKQTYFDSVAVFYRMARFVDGEEAALKKMRQYFGDAQYVGYQTP